MKHALCVLALACAPALAVPTHKQPGHHRKRGGGRWLSWTLTAIAVLCLWLRSRTTRAFEVDTAICANGVISVAAKRLWASTQNLAEIEKLGTPTEIAVCRLGCEMLGDLLTVATFRYLMALSRTPAGASSR